ncbi:MAG: family 43 glycosylhydrolase, partial [Peptococcaceae bacterium]|nr:family 43 glycosylhydrolase [Peptococcaceae bacterium]
MKRGFNPILPLDEYIPDGEPHVFGDRVYLFGSHDTEDGDKYCAERNYVGWSAPLDDLTSWHYEGEIYTSNQDPDYQEDGEVEMYAPDVVQGNDGRYYLYYGYSGSGHDKISVAVSDTPTGRYKYHGFVRNIDGSVYKEYLMGDPAAINDDGVIRLYFGWSLSSVAAEAHAQGENYEEQKKKYEDNAPQMQLPSPGDPLMNQKMAPLYKMVFHRKPDEVIGLKHPLMGANTIELENDMLTVAGEAKRIIPGQFDTPPDSCFFGHAFYEASSIRKINGMYYFIYSSENSNELCYATSQYPDREFNYGGIIISNGNVGYKGIKKEDSQNMTGNNHGSLALLNREWYIFYHRHTHKSTFSRQACAEKVVIEKDGRIRQVECTSMGLGDRPFSPDGEFPAPVCCV